MPGLSFIKILGNLKFLSHGLKLPTSDMDHGAAPSDMYTHGDNPRKAFKLSDMSGPTLIPPWFMNKEPPNKHYQKSCDDIGQEFKDFHDTMLDAIGYSVTMWKLQAKFKDLKVNALTALGTPGCLDGPELESNIKNAPMCAAFSGNKAKHRDAVAKGISGQWKKWQEKVMVPGLPWYPAFVAFPGPMAPPMPNIPMPLIVCPSPMMAEMMVPSKLQGAMDDALDGGLKDKDVDKQYEALHDAIATCVSLAFLMWLPSQQIMLVLGKGPIPTFAPPFVPVGPVVMGDNIGTPGHLMT